MWYPDAFHSQKTASAAEVMSTIPAHRWQPTPQEPNTAAVVMETDDRLIQTDLQQIGALWSSVFHLLKHKTSAVKGPTQIPIELRWRQRR